MESDYIQLRQLMKYILSRPGAPSLDPALKYRGPLVSRYLG
jgi:hypothetical protein